VYCDLIVSLVPCNMVLMWEMKLGGGVYKVGVLLEYFCFSSVYLTNFVINFFLIKIGWHDPSYGLR
jgi:hypothetical protein